MNSRSEFDTLSNETKRKIFRREIFEIIDIIDFVDLSPRSIILISLLEMPSIILMNSRSEFDALFQWDQNAQSHHSKQFVWDWSDQYIQQQNRNLLFLCQKRLQRVNFHLQVPCIINRYRTQKVLLEPRIWNVFYFVVAPHSGKISMHRFSSLFAVWSETRLFHFTKLGYVMHQSMYLGCVGNFEIIKRVLELFDVFSKIRIITQSKRRSDNRI